MRKWRNYLVNGSDGFFWNEREEFWLGGGREGLALFSLFLAEILFFRCRLLRPLSILCWVFTGANLYGCLPVTLYSSSINC